MRNLEEDFASYPDFIESVKNLRNEKLPLELTRRDAQGKFEVNKIFREKIR